MSTVTVAFDAALQMVEYLSALNILSAGETRTAAHRARSYLTETEWSTDKTGARLTVKEAQAIRDSLITLELMLIPLNLEARRRVAEVHHALSERIDQALSEQEAAP